MISLYWMINPESHHSPVPLSGMAPVPPTLTPNPTQGIFVQLAPSHPSSLASDDPQGPPLRATYSLSHDPA